MSEAIHDGRWTVDYDGELIVFIIGMRINHPLNVRKWLPVFLAMGKMLKWLDAHPEAGLLHHEKYARNPLEPMVLQYWRSFDELAAFARDPGAAHLGPWKAFNQKVRDSGEVGIWHETYRVAPGSYETIYGNMPPRGIGRVGTLRPVGSTGAGQTAAVRIGDETEDRPPVAPY